MTSKDKAQEIVQAYHSPEYQSGQLPSLAAMIEDAIEGAIRDAAMVAEKFGDVEIRDAIEKLTEEG